MYSVKELLAAAGDIPEGIKQVLRQARTAKEQPTDRATVEGAVEEFDIIFTPDDDFILPEGYEWVVEDEDGTTT